MSVRTKLILIFLGLSVVPLALLTFLSYSSSRQAFKELVERDNHAAASNLQERVASLNGEIRRRVVAVTELPEFEAIDFSRALSPGDTEKLARAMRREVGDRWDVFADLEFEAEPPPSPAAPRPASAVSPPGRAALRDAPPSTPGPGALARAGDEDPDRQDESYTVRIILPDFSQLAGDTDVIPELKQYRLDFEKGVSTENSMRRLGAEMEGLIHNLSYLPGLFVQTGGDGRTIKLRNLADEVRAELMKLEKAERAEAPVEVGSHLARQRRLAILERLDRTAEELAQPITVAVERGGERVGSLIARVRPDRMLADVFGATTLEEGEIVFAVDPLGRLHTQQLADLDTLRDLGLLAGEGPPRPGSPSPAAMAVTQDAEALTQVVEDPDWITVIERDEETGYSFGIVRRVASELGAIRRAALMNLFLGFLFIGLAGSGVVVFSGRMTRGLELLTEGARQIAGGDLAHRIDARRRDELGQLAVAFNEMAADLDASRRRLVEQERLERELEIARTIQRDSLPRGGFSGESVEIAGRSIPSLEVGGDFFNFLAVDSGRTAILVGDVSGKGVPAALMMAEVQATLRTLLRYQDDPARIITQMNHDLEGSKPANVYFTVFLGILDPRGGQLTYVNAGQTPPFILRASGELVHLAPNSRPVGLFADSPMRADTVALRRGDLLCVYTDGVVESSARTEAEEFFGEDRLVEAVRSAAGRPLDGVIDEVAGRLTGFHGQGALEDDATLVVARIAAESAGEHLLPPGERTDDSSLFDLPVV